MLREAPGADAEKINGSCPVNVQFSVLDEYEHRRNEAVNTCEPGLEPASPEKLGMLDPLRCNLKHSETF